ncbi:MAG: MBOAT family O-acyltransferase [Bacteroidota bacterium]
MLFNSLAFFLFLPAVFILYWFVFNRSLRWQNMLVLVASYFFYGWWSWEFMALLVLCTLMDYGYAFGVASENRHRAKIFLWLSIINNLGILAVFKYYDFFATELASALSSIGFETHPLLLQMVLPIGISFYTFHGMSYVFDIYKGRVKPVTDFVEYAVFVSFFPLLVAGPIERATHLLPQIRKARLFQRVQAVAGCRLILWGLFKKVVVADSLAPFVDNAFTNADTVGSLQLIAGVVAFAFQIYGDFSGYSDIALGTAKLFGFELLSNFRFPYFSRDLAEFWRRWHISLSSWFRDYLYIPLGGSQGGKATAIRNTFVIFLVSGFWHGASWNFIFWGLIHACGFLPLLLAGQNRKHTGNNIAEGRSLPSWREWRGMIFTFIFVSFAWVFFRAESFLDAVDYIQNIFIWTPVNTWLDGSWKVLLWPIILVLSDWYLRHDERSPRVPTSKSIRYALYICCTVTVLYHMMLEGKNTFIYFQF